MKKSEIYRMAMLAVVDCEFYAEDKLEILAELGSRKTVAEWCEEDEAKKEQEEVNNG